MNHWTENLERLAVCPDAMVWAKDYASLEAAWAACPRGDWMLWLITREVVQDSPEHRRVIACLVACCRPSLEYAGEWRETLAGVYDTLDAWAKGEEANLDAALSASYAAERASYAAWRASYAALSASDAAERASYAAWRASYAAWRASYAVWRVSYAAGSASDAAWSASEAAQADIVRKHYPTPPPF